MVVAVAGLSLAALVTLASVAQAEPFQARIGTPVGGSTNCKIVIQAADGSCSTSFKVNDAAINIVESASGQISASCSGKLDPNNLPAGVSLPQHASVCSDATYSGSDGAGNCIVYDNTASDDDSTAGDALGSWHATLTPSGNYKLTCQGTEAPE